MKVGAGLTYTEGMSSRPLKRRVVYGPINSKRLGRSLGVNLLPTDKKVCTFDCVYCHYGRTAAGPYDLPQAERIIKEVREALLGKPEIDYITFAGHGEPSLHMDFLEIAEALKDLRDEMVPEAKVALLTNSSKLSRPDVARVCRLIDTPICKLDAGNEETFKRVNRPRPNIYLEDIVRGIKALPEAIIQTMVVEGDAGNSDEADVESLVETIKEAEPAFVQVYSIDFPIPGGSLRPVENERLTEIAKLITDETGVDAKAYWESE